MPRSYLRCVCEGCDVNTRDNRDLSFWPLPTKQSSPHLREQWLEHVRLKPGISLARNLGRICSKHFVGGEPSEACPLPMLFSYNNYHHYQDADIMVKSPLSEVSFYLNANKSQRTNPDPANPENVCYKFDNILTEIGFVPKRARVQDFKEETDEQRLSKSLAFLDEQAARKVKHQSTSNQTDTSRSGAAYKKTKSGMFYLFCPDPSKSPCAKTRQCTVPAETLPAPPTKRVESTATGVSLSQQVPSTNPRLVPEKQKDLTNNGALPVEADVILTEHECALQAENGDAFNAELSEKTRKVRRSKRKKRYSKGSAGLRESSLDNQHDQIAKKKLDLSDVISNEMACPAPVVACSHASEPGKKALVFVPLKIPDATYRDVLRETSTPTPGGVDNTVNPSTSSATWTPSLFANASSKTLDGQDRTDACPVGRCALRPLPLVLCRSQPMIAESSGITVLPSPDAGVQATLATAQGEHKSSERKTSLRDTKQHGLLRKKSSSKSVANGWKGRRRDNHPFRKTLAKRRQARGMRGEDPKTLALMARLRNRILSACKETFGHHANISISGRLNIVLDDLTPLSLDIRAANLHRGESEEGSKEGLIAPI